MQRDSMTQHKILRQSIGDIISGVARTSPRLGHSMGTLRFYEILREVQKYLGESVACSSRKFLEFDSLPGRF